MTYVTGSKLKHGGFRDKKHCALVLDGNTVKHRLYADRIKAQTPVHVDWLRFTVALRLCPTPSVDVLFPPNAIKWKYEHERLQQFQRLLAAIPDAEFGAAAQAMELGNQVVHILGPDFDLNPELRKGHDFYRHRFSVERCGQEVGWIGFLAAGNSPKQKGQSNSLHVNLYGSACTFAEFGWRDLMADLIEDLDGDITRADLALDFFDGMPGMNMDSIVDDYKAGAMNAGGKKLTCNMVGDWANGFERSFYIGTKEGGKQTNVYEKGQQLFGREAGSKWTRVELRWGNKLRVLPADILRRPADFFACASDWHTLMLSKADAIPSPAALPCKEELQIQTVQAEVTRSLRWLRDVAAPTVAFAINFMDFRELWDLIGTPQLPQRLSKFKADELKAAAAGSYERFIQPAAAGPGMQVVHPLAA